MAGSSFVKLIMSLGYIRLKPGCNLLTARAILTSLVEVKNLMNFAIDWWNDSLDDQLYIENSQTHELADNLVNSDNNNENYLGNMENQSMNLIDNVFDYFFGYVKQLFMPRRAVIVDKEDNVLTDDEAALAAALALSMSYAKPKEEDWVSIAAAGLKKEIQHKSRKRKRNIGDNRRRKRKRLRKRQVDESKFSDPLFVNQLLSDLPSVDINDPQFKKLMENDHESFPNRKPRANKVLIHKPSNIDDRPKLAIKGQRVYIEHFNDGYNSKWDGIGIISDIILDEDLTLFLCNQQGSYKRKIQKIYRIVVDFGDGNLASLLPNCLSCVD